MTSASDQHPRHRLEETLATSAKAACSSTAPRLLTSPGVGLALADPPVRAPVLLQHILRHVLSNEPKQRAGYFKALFLLTDLDSFRVNALTATPAASAGAAISALTKKPLTTTDSARTAVDKALRAAGGAILVDAEGVEPVFETVDHARAGSARIRRCMRSVFSTAASTRSADRIRVDSPR